MLYYNKTELTRIGSPNGPKNWSDFQAICDKLFADGKQCYDVEASPESFVALVWGRGGDANSELSANVFNGSQAVAALSADVDNIKAGKAKAYGSGDSS